MNLFHYKQVLIQTYLESPVIIRLISAGKRKNSDLSVGKDRVILFARQVKKSAQQSQSISYSYIVLLGSGELLLFGAAISYIIRCGSPSSNFSMVSTRL